jgi:hypothetical protein
MTEKIIATAVLMVGSAAMIFARRYKNATNAEAGSGVAAWTIILLLCIWVLG